MTLGVGVEHVIESAEPYSSSVRADGDRSELVLTVDANPGVPVQLTKYIACQSSRVEPSSELVERAALQDRQLHVELTVLQTAQARAGASH
jgi:alpha,alpha-trehalose phosphorylase